jgi:hypothetical protein
MKKVSKFNVGMALGSLTAAVALLAGAPAASAQTAPGSSDTSVAGQAAPGGGSFPGSFLVPGTNTSIKIGGFAKVVGIYDFSANGQGPDGNVVVPGAIPLNGAAKQPHGNVRLHAKQSNVNFDARTPTSYGELETFILIDFFGQTPTNTFGGSNTQNARLVLAYGTLGPLLGGQALSLFFDGDALGETVDPTASVGINNGLTNRQPQIRYTYAGPGGFSLAGSIEQPNWEGIDNGLGAVQASVTGGALTTQRYPDFLLKGRLDQGWGHAALAFVIHDQKALTNGAAIPRNIDNTGWGINLTGHLNTFGKDTLRGGFMYGKALGHYLSDFGIVAGFESNTLAVGAPNTAPTSYGANVSYTHWWTDSLRSTLMGGYSHLDVNTGILTLAAIQNAVDKTHIGGTINLVWSPVPQVDLGIEYTRIHRIVAGPNPAFGVGSEGSMNRAEIETVFKF